MTITTKLQTLLANHGLWPNEVEEVIALVKAAPENDPMKDRWNDDESDYPPQIVNLAWFSAKTHAIEYLENNKPKHFALMILKRA